MRGQYWFIIQQRNQKRKISGDQDVAFLEAGHQQSISSPAEFLFAAFVSAKD